MKSIILLFIGFFMSSFTSLETSELSKKPIVSAENYLRYKHEKGHETFFTVPPVILICYQQTLFDALIDTHSLHPIKRYLYVTEDQSVGVLGGWGIGAPALANKIEQLIVRGAKHFIAIGTAGTLTDHSPGSMILSPKALAEDGVAVHYLPEGENLVSADPMLLSLFEGFMGPDAELQIAQSWSFSAIYKESPYEVQRVKELGCGVVEMETATLYAIGQEKGVGALSIFIISDSLELEGWTPHLREVKVRKALENLGNQALEFCREISYQRSSM